ncbi:hypothetical protein LV79_003186 [Actinokineospora globicatena]|nr:hypothetical protein [Actinokineospora globicatena]GLW79385.1 hypothetical protein Aglo01_38670 [Actinokineospora globicatena]GLW86205.1 hypothetical protein Aglo02_38440 [Actinokineospora globicatena]
MGGDQVHNQVGSVDGLVVQVGDVGGDLTVCQAFGVPAVPLIVTIGSDSTLWIEARGQQAVIVSALRTVVQDEVCVVDERWDVPITVSAGAPVRLTAMPELLNQDVGWHLEIDWICGGRRGTLRVPESGHVILATPVARVSAPLVTDVRLRNIDYVAFVDDGVVEEVPASGHTVQLTVTGLSGTPVLLADLRVEVITRSDRSGTLVRHAGEVPRRRFEVQLDVEPPRLAALGGSDFPYVVGPHESECFDLKVSTHRGDVAWILWLDWRRGRDTGSVRVDLGGHPFRTAGRWPR